VNRKNTKTIGKHRKVVEKTTLAYKCISEGRMRVAAWYHGTPDQSSRNSGNKFRLPDPYNVAKFRRAPTKSVRDIRCEKWKILLPGKSWPKCTLGLQICHQSLDRTRVSIDTL